MCRSSARRASINGGPICKPMRTARNSRGEAREFPFVRVFGEIALVGLSSARPTIPGMASGWLGARQMRQIGPLLDALGREGFCRVVMIHHPPLPGMTAWQRALHDAGAFRRLLERHGAELVLHGHNHRAMIARLEGQGGPIPIVGASSASVASEIPAQRAGYNLFSIQRGGNGGWRIAMHSRVFNPGRALRMNIKNCCRRPQLHHHPLCRPCKNVVGQERALPGFWRNQHAFQPWRRTPMQKRIDPIWWMVLAAGTILAINMGIRQTFGLFLKPMTLDLGVSRQAFSLLHRAAESALGPRLALHRRAQR